MADNEYCVVAYLAGVRRLHRDIIFRDDLLCFDGLPIVFTRSEDATAAAIEALITDSKVFEKGLFAYRVHEVQTINTLHGRFHSITIGQGIGSEGAPVWIGYHSELSARVDRP